jgi:hypothetical protein
MLFRFSFSSPSLSSFSRWNTLHLWVQLTHLVCASGRLAHQPLPLPPSACLPHYSQEQSQRPDPSITLCSLPWPCCLPYQHPRPCLMSHPHGCHFSQSNCSSLEMCLLSPLGLCVAFFLFLEC